MDVARCARRLPGVESVHLACLERRDEMPAHSWEAAEALEEGVVFHNSLGPTEIIVAEGKVTGVAFRACTRVFDEAGRFSPQFDDSQTSTLAADTVIVTIGQGIDAASMSPVVTGPGGRIVADPRDPGDERPRRLRRRRRGPWPGFAIDAIAHGPSRGGGHSTPTCAGRAREAALPARREDAAKTAPNPRPDAPRQSRRPMPQTAAEERVQDMREIDLGYSEEEAVAEAQALPQLRPLLRLPSLREGVRPGRNRPRHAAADRGPGGRRRHPDAGLRGVRGVGARRVRPRPLRQRRLSSLQFERMLSASGPDGRARSMRPADGGPVRRVAFIQCVGSRDSACGNGYCSSLCCMSATKEAMVALEHDAEAWRSPSSASTCAPSARSSTATSPAPSDEHGVRYVRAIPSRVVEMPGSKDLRLRYFDDEGKRADGGLRPRRALGRTEAGRKRRRACRAVGHRAQRVRLLRDRPSGAGRFVAAGRLRGRRVPGAEGHTGVGGAGERGGGRGDGAAARRPRHRWCSATSTRGSAT